MSSQDSMSESDKKSPTACVVGAGISGVSSALFLAKKGYKVTVVDQRELVGTFLLMMIFNRFLFFPCRHIYLLIFHTFSYFL